jgi:tetratricopeptide (TPR) repeat protein
MRKKLGLAGLLLLAVVQTMFSQIPSARDLDERLATVRGLVETSPQEALKGAEALIVDLPESDELRRIEAWIIMANASSNLGEHEQGMDLATKAQVLSRERGFFDQELAARYAQINIHRSRGELDDEIRIGIESLALAEQVRNDRQIMVMANSLGTSYSRKGEYDLAIASYQKGYDHTLAAKDLEAQAKMLNNLSSLMIILKNFDQALEFMQKGLDLAEKQRDFGNVAVMLTNRAYLFDELGREKEQLADLERALKLAWEGGLALGHMGRYNEAFPLFKTALDGFSRAKMEAEVIEVTRIMSAAYEMAGFPAQALVHYKEFKEKSDALFQNEKQKAVMDLQEKYSTIQKQKEIEILSQNNRLKSVQLERNQAQRNIILLIAVSLVLLSFLVFQRYRITKNPMNNLKFSMQN